MHRDTAREKQRNLWAGQSLVRNGHIFKYKNCIIHNKCIKLQFTFRVIQIPQKRQAIQHNKGKSIQIT